MEPIYRTASQNSNFETASINLTFDNMPAAIMDLHRKFDKILLRLQEIDEPKKDILLEMDGLINFLPENPARQTVYGWVNNRSIPYEKHGKKLYFRKSAIENWLDSGRKC